MINRVQAAVRSPDGLQRLAHFILAKVLFALPRRVRKRFFSGSAFYCPICDSHLSQFLVLHRSYHLWCPVCRSLQRHRLIWLLFQQRGFFLEKPPRRMLHVAPEEALAQYFRQVEGMDYLSGDLYNPRAMVKMDICNIQYPDETFDFLLCSHVLEHVMDDQQAMREFYRVLTRDGWALILVPIASPKTFKDPSIIDPAERERAFGQLDHLRSYGPDVQDRLKAAGFQVHLKTTHDIATGNDLRRMGLEDNETLFICEKRL